MFNLVAGITGILWITGLIFAVINAIEHSPDWWPRAILMMAITVAALWIWVMARR